MSMLAKRVVSVKAQDLLPLVQQIAELKLVELKLGNSDAKEDQDRLIPHDALLFLRILPLLKYLEDAVKIDLEMISDPSKTYKDGVVSGKHLLWK